MSQRELNEMVARATGESLTVVDRLGFHLADPLDVNNDPEAAPAAGLRLGQHVPGRLAATLTETAIMAVMRQAPQYLSRSVIAMPLKLNIAMSRKVGERNYGSRGATVGLEMEVDSSLVDQPRELHRRIARLFRLAKASVDRELAAQIDASGGAAAAAHHPRRATANQVRAIHAIAQRQDLDLGEEVRTRFGVSRPDDLSLQQASQLIDAIKPSANGVMD